MTGIMCARTYMSTTILKANSDHASQSVVHTYTMHRATLCPTIQYSHKYTYMHIHMYVCTCTSVCTYSTRQKFGYVWFQKMNTKHCGIWFRFLLPRSTLLQFYFVHCEGMHISTIADHHWALKWDQGCSFDECNKSRCLFSFPSV